MPFLVVSLGAGGLSLLARRDARVSALIGGIGLVLAVAAATFVRGEPPVVFGGLEVAGSDAGRLLLLVGAATGGLLVLVAASTQWLPALPGATLIGLGGAGIAVSLADTGTAVIAATAGAVAALLAAKPETAGERSLATVARQLRVVVGGGLLALAALAVAGGPLALGRVDPALTGLVWLVVAGAAALRVAAVPFHVWAARVADTAPMVALPLVLALAPAVFALIVIGWSTTTVEPALTPLGVERSALAVVAVLSIAFGTIATLVHGDLAHIVMYAFVADAGVALLALVALDPAAAAPLAAWLAAWVASRSALAGWAAAAAAAWQTNRLDELHGWARRSPVLAIALVVIAAASIGWPGAAVAAARADIVRLVADGPPGAILLGFALATSAVYVRLLIVGLQPPAQRLTADPPRWPRLRGTRDRRSSDPPASRADSRTPIAAGGVMALAVVAALVSAGALSG